MAVTSGQITVDSATLDNGDWRRLVGQNIYSEVRDGAEQLVFLFREFTVVGQTPTELMSRWNETVRDFSRRNAAIVSTVDDDSTESLADLSAFNGVNTANSCSVEMLDEWVQTSTSLRCMFKAQASRTLTAGSAEPGGGGGEPLDGQIDGINLAIVRSAGRIESRAATGTFGTTFISDVSVVTITDVVNNSGKVRFVCSGAPPEFVASMRIRVAGTASNNGFHRVVATSESPNLVDTDTDFTVAEAGISGATGSIGETRTARENYDSARQSLLTDYLLTNNDGSRSADGLVLDEESTQENDSAGELSFVLSSSFAPVAYPAGDLASSGRKQEIVITSHRVPWSNHPMAGPPPTLVTVSGSFSVMNQSQTAATRWASFRPTLIAMARQHTGKMDLVAVHEDVAFSPNTREVGFQLQLRTSSPLIMGFSFQKRVSMSPEFTRWRDGDKLYGQRPDGPDNGVITYSIARVGEGKVDLTMPPPDDFGLNWIEGPKAYDESSETTVTGQVLWTQSMTVSFLPFSPNTSPRVVSPEVFANRPPVFTGR